MNTRISLAALLLSATAAYAAPESPEIGTTVKRLSFTDIHYLPRTLDELGEAKAVVLFYATVECPLVRRYMPRVVKLETAYRDKGVKFVAVNVGNGDSIVDMATQAIEQDAPFPFLKDFSHKTAKRLGIDRSATVVVLDAKGVLRYRGRVDDQYRLGGVRPAATRNDLREAIDDVLAGRPVRVSETPVDGCKVSPPIRTEDPTPPTFAKDIAPIFNTHCVSCHRPGTEAPFSLLTYEKAFAHSDMIGETVLHERMPPWFASEKWGAFENHRGLSSSEKETVLRWVRAGAPSGDLSQAPTPPTFDVKRWTIGKPDLILQVQNEAVLPAEGYVDYKYEFLMHRFAEDTWISDVQISPENPAVLHHANLAFVPPNGSKRFDFITGQVPGGEPMQLDEGQGFLIPKDAMLVLQIHYVTTGKPERDRISVGFRYPRWKVKQRLRHMKVTTSRYTIPAGAAAHEVRASRTLKTDADAIAMFSHMHLRGRDMRFLAHTPDGKTETLLLIPNYSFDWQLAYRWKKGTRRFPKGTRIECIGHYDNSVFNPYNPDPSKSVRHGEQTYHEMFFGFFFYTDPNEALNLRIDPTSGRVQTPLKAKGRRYFK
jgi:thiol-disulfide isomerase/thioredoxin